MIEKEVIVANRLGLHARPAALFVQMSNKFTSDIFIEKDTKRVSGKSIMGVMSLGVGKGDTIFIIAKGPDEEEALESLVNLIENVLIDM